jgi:Domain of unknown function (DUF397)
MMENHGTRPDKVTWHKSSWSNGGADCVEVADLGFAIRDSKDPSGPQLRFTRQELAAFLKGARGGEFDHLLNVTA